MKKTAKVTDKSIYGASNLKFLNEDNPVDIEIIFNAIGTLINTEMASSSSNYSSEEISDLRYLNKDLEELPYNDFIDLDYPKFSLTPHEYDWLKCHEKETWIEYLLYRYKFKMYPISFMIIFF